MLYLANPAGPDVVAAMAAGHLGLIDSPRQQQPTRVGQAHAAGVPWCADNGCFSGAGWSAEGWWAWLTRDVMLERRPTCLFAVAPDVVGDAAATLELSTPWLPQIRAAGFPVAYVAQDGQEALALPDADVVFLGGSTDWKLGPGARAVAAAAIAAGVPVHMGRVNSEKRWRYARAIGCSTVDGTFLTYGPRRRLPDLLAWGRNLGQPYLV